jgi:hypothetical protein
MRDPKVKQVITDLASTNPEVAQPWTAKGYLLNQSVLYYYPQEGDDEETKLVVPVHDRRRIMKEFHDSPLLDTIALQEHSTKYLPDAIGLE